MTFQDAVIGNLGTWVAVAAALLTAFSGLAIYLRGNASRPWRRWVPYGTAAAVLLFAGFAVLLWRQPGADVAAELNAALNAAAARGNEARPEAYAQRLREHLDSQPRDARSWVLYARAEAELDRFEESVRAYEKALSLSEKVAKDAAVWCEYADALGMMQGGSLRGKPLEHVRRALMIDPSHPRALEMAGSAEYEQGRYAQALEYWRPLLAKIEPGSRMHKELTEAIARTERMAGSNAAAGKSLSP